MDSPMEPVSITLNTSPQAYKNLSRQVPKGWTKETVTRAISLGYSRFSIHMLQPSSECWTFDLLMQKRSVQKLEVLDPFMIIKQNEYIHVKSDNIRGQIVTPALAAKREQFLTLERQRLSEAVPAKISLSPSLNPENSYVTEHTAVS